MFVRENSLFILCGLNTLKKKPVHIDIAPTAYSPHEEIYKDRAHNPSVYQHRTIKNPWVAVNLSQEIDTTFVPLQSYQDTEMAGSQPWLFQ